MITCHKKIEKQASEPTMICIFKYLILRSVHIKKNAIKLKEILTLRK